MKTQKINITRTQYNWREADYEIETENIPEDTPESIGIILAEVLGNHLSDIRKGLQQEDKELYNNYVQMLLDHIQDNLLQ